MNIKRSLTAILLLTAFGVQAQQASFVDYDAYEQLVKEVKNHRASRLLPLDQFLEKAKEPNTVILDTRSREMYDLKHVKGAIHLNFSDFTQDQLDQLMAQCGAQNAQILIYCNNNFTDKSALNLQDLAFVTKSARPLPVRTGKVPLPPARPLTLALNIPTYINLFGYGYRNVYELSELVDVNDPRIQFEGTFTRKANTTRM